MTCLGTIQSNRKGLPRAFTAVDNRPVGDYQVLYDVASNISIHSEICKNKSGKNLFGNCLLCRFLGILVINVLAFF